MRRGVAALAAVLLGLSTWSVTARAENGAATAAAAPKTIDGRVDDWLGASPMLGGVSAVSAGELVYQDFIYDDTGAAIGTGQTANGGRGTGAKTYGTYRYPTNMARYRSNAADLFQLRAALDGDRVQLLVRLNTLVEADTTVVGIAFGNASSPRVDWPLNAKLATPADHVLTLWGTGGQWDDAPLESVGGALAVDTDTNAMEVSLPASLTGTAFRLYAATGLWSGTGWMDVVANRTPTEPGGGNGVAPNAFNVAFRTGETDAVEAWADGNFWFEQRQADALAAGSIDQWYLDVDLTAPDSPPFPVAGLQQAIHRLSVTPPPHEGFVEHGVSGNNEDPLNAGRGRGCSLLTLPLPSCTAFALAGPWQPYAVYVPPGGYDRMQVWLHGGTYPLNYTLVRNIQRQLGDDARSLLVEPVALGPSSWFTDEAQLAVIEAVRDAQARFGLGPVATTVGGISMGGYGANRLLVTNPDLFAGGILHSAAVGDVSHEYGGSRYEDVLEPGQGNPVDLQENNRNHRLLVVHGVADQSAYYALLVPQVRRMEELGYPHEVLSHPTWQHTTVFTVNHWRREAAFVGSLPASASVNPAHVTYSTSEAWWRPDLGSPDLVFDRAYWVSGLRLRDTSGGFRSKGTVDAVTLGLGAGEPVTEAIPAAVFSGPPAPYSRTGWEVVGSAPLPVANRFEATLTNLSTVTFDAERMGLDVSAADFGAVITTDGPVQVRIGGSTFVIGAAGTYTIGALPPGEEPPPPPPPDGEAGLVADCTVTGDPGPQSFTVVPPTGNGGTNVTTGDGSARLSSPGTGSYYVVTVEPGGARAYGRRDGSTDAGEPDRAEAHDVTAGPSPWACVASPAAGVGVQGP